MQYKVTADEEQLRDNQLIDLPASKSLSNRALILQALCTEPCQLTHLSDCDDTQVMLAAFEKVKSAIAPNGSAVSNQQASANEPLTIDIGAAGTSMRFLTAYFASREGAEVIMTGSERMKQRPIKILVDALLSLGAEIEYLEAEGCPPLRIHGRQLAGGPLSIDGSTSSQYISALLMIAPTLANGMTLTLTGDVTSRPYILMTLGMMREFGVESDWTDNVITVAPQTYRAQSYEVESDWSAASYWYEVLALAHDTQLKQIRLKGLHQVSFQGDSHIADYFAPLGIETRFTDEGVTLCYGEEGFKRPERLDWDMTEQPDLAQTLIVTYANLDICFNISGLHTLRIKETDRIAALENELLKLGIVVTDSDNDRMMYDKNEIEIGDTIAPIDTYKDHRMAMAFAPAALYVMGEPTLLINDPGVVSKSYPQYWEHLKQIGYSVEEFDIVAAAEAERKARTRKHWGYLVVVVIFLLLLLAIKFCF